MNNGWPLHDDILGVFTALLFLAFSHVEFLVF